jgi:hypothetical protein
MTIKLDLTLNDVRVTAFEGEKANFITISNPNDKTPYRMYVEIYDDKPITITSIKGAARDCGISDGTTHEMMARLFKRIDKEKSEG